jgi:hypothetical protein
MFGLGLALFGSALALQAQQGRFHLPYKAEWGGVTLEPGDYRVSQPEVSLGKRLFYVSGEKSQGYIAPTVTDIYSLSAQGSKHSYLKLVKVDGKLIVAQYQSAANSTTFSFRVPKSKHKEQMADDGAINLEVSGN